MWVYDVVVEYLCLINELKLHISREMHRYCVPAWVTGKISDVYGYK